MLRTMHVIASRPDPCTLSNYHDFRTEHTTVNLTVDFQQKKITGSVLLALSRLKESNKVVLDTSYLDIQSVEVNGTPTTWNLTPRVEPFGSPLEIELDGKAAAMQGVFVVIECSTTDNCTALQWLTPEQTSNKKHPYMFSQCQAIHARSCFPCQDTPAVKSPFTFNIKSPLPVLVSGLPVEDSATKEPGANLYKFEQNVPIPSYLFALASGDIQTASIGPRSKVATGPDELKAAQWELGGDMEAFIEAAESLIPSVPYAWGTYNVLILPPSFPYGGMENPIYTFATPTIISGDKQNIDVIAHELVRSSIVNYDLDEVHANLPARHTHGPVISSRPPHGSISG